MPKNARRLSTNCENQVWKSKGVCLSKAIEQPLDPQRLAQGVRNEEEATEIYFLSCAAIDIDHFMERSYLNALGDAKIPQEVRDGIEQDLQQQNRRYRADNLPLSNMFRLHHACLLPPL